MLCCMPCCTQRNHLLVVVHFLRHEDHAKQTAVVRHTHQREQLYHVKIIAIAHLAEIAVPANQRANNVQHLSHM
jgi:hypothetical protein